MLLSVPSQGSGHPNIQKLRILPACLAPRPARMGEAGGTGDRPPASEFEALGVGGCCTTSASGPRNELPQPRFAHLRSGRDRRACPVGLIERLGGDYCAQGVARAEQGTTFNVLSDNVVRRARGEEGRGAAGSPHCHRFISWLQGLRDGPGRTSGPCAKWLLGRRKVDGKCCPGLFGLCRLPHPLGRRGSGRRAGAASGAASSAPLRRSL